MTAEAWDQLAQAVIAIGGTLAGVWFVLRLVVGYQRDFTDRYAARLGNQDQRIEALERKVEHAERAVAECEAREQRLIWRLTQAGIDL